ncbi:prepilin-type N-terminal cleavage/methylation domain-containing protein [Deinococcus sp. Leaf326]|uniref:prepilin-type N-terminal cleavage/methylation domain-containing protein n=1 Tax=Deinococcus sp. Leaf326 TaxID=1736338 RepID=UPI0006FBAB5C|nr:prepilin-type N-terminal cleavage/methylation domain-containing protein [Deinococcus sp. Leaf326]KQR11257.1 hypothetical protein ASF71_20655 [Deinococcus sp. Leaf326]
MTQNPHPYQGHNVPVNQNRPHHEGMREEGFTLVEILIVIAIIGILAAVLVGNFSGSLRTGNRTAAKAHGYQVSLAIQQWLSQSPVRTVSSLTGLNCAQGYALISTGPQANNALASGQLGWKAPTGSITCSIAQGTSARTALVTTKVTGDSKTFVNGEAQ